jgi:flagellar motor protein MotB
MSSKNPFHPPTGKSRPAPPASGPDEPPEPPPAANPVAPTGRPEIETVPASMWTIAGYLVLLTLLGLVGYSLLEQKRANDEMLHRLAERDQELGATRQHTFQTETALTTAQQTIAELQAEADELKRAKEAATSAQQNLESRMRDALASRDITISELQGKLTLSILDRILFDSGQAVIKPEGQEVLRKLAAVLDQFPNRQIHVTGHTDNVPIRTAQFPSNWELSAARALAALRFLVEEAGVNPTRLAAVAHGEFQPVADNATPEGRAKNRRIAIVVLPEVFKSPETPPAVAAPLAEEEPSPNAVPLPEPVEPNPGS